MTELNNGSIRISDEVIADIAIKAALDVEGVASVHSRVLESARSLISGRFTGVKGVALVPSDDGMNITIQISVLFGNKIPAVCTNVQREVADSVSDMTGITVCGVNVCVISVTLPKSKSKKNGK